MLLALGAAALLAATAPTDIIDPRPGSHVVDLTGTLGASELVDLNAAAERAAAGGELVVVVVPSTGGMDARRWTTAVFNRLGLDDKARNRGVLLMAALKDRAAEIVVGDGYPASVTHTTDSIMSSVVVARFKAGDPSAALVGGARALVDRVILRGVSAAAGAAPSEPAPPTPTPMSAELRAAMDDPVVASVPDPRDQGGVVDGARALGKAERNAIAAAQASASDVELWVVSASQTGSLSPSVFARALFARLQEAKEQPQSALLFLVAPPAKKTKKGKAPPPPPAAEVVLGSAFPKELADVIAARVVAGWSLRATAPRPEIGEATVEAVEALAGLHGELERWRAEDARAKEKARQQRMADATRRAQAAAARLEQEGSRERGGGGPIPGGLLGLGVMGVGLFGTGMGVREVIRRWPRKCRKCQVPMERLGEQVDDQHLSEGEKAEERLGSVDYDVWSCPECGELRKLRWGAVFSGYSRCGSCSYRTLSTSRRTLQAATQYSTGLAEITERCAHCNYSNRYTRVIPRRPKPSSSSSSGYRSSGGSRGSSSGRGSSGRW